MSQALEKLHPDVDRVIPEGISLLNDAVHIGGHRVATDVQSDSQSYGPSSKIVIRIPAASGGLSDFRDHQLTFIASCTNSVADSEIWFTSGIHSIIDSVRVFIGAQEVSNIQNYAYLHSALDKRHPAEWYGTVGRTRAGYSTTAERESWSSGRKYAIKLYPGILNDIVPTSMINLQMRVEIQLTDVTRCLVSDTDGTTSATVNFNIQQVYLKYHEIYPEESFMVSLRDKIYSNGLLKGYHDYDSYVLTGLASNQVQIDLPFKYSSFKGVFAMILDTNQLSTIFAGTTEIATRIPDTKTVDQLYQNQTQYQLRVNSIWYPRTPVDTTLGAAEAYEYLVDGLDRRRESSMAAGCNFTTDRAIIALGTNTAASSALVASVDPMIDLAMSYIQCMGIAPYPRRTEIEEHVFSGVDTAAAGSVVTFSSVFSGNINTGMYNSGTAQYNIYGGYEYGVLYMNGGIKVIR